MTTRLLIVVLALSVFTSYAQKTTALDKAIYLENISWTSAKEVLTPDAVVVIPLGAASKEHGPHLPLSTDYVQAVGITKILAAERKVIIAPTVSYGHYPSFLRYPGSTSLSFATSTEVILEIVRSLSGYGPKRFYVINIGVTTTLPLANAAKVLANDGILLTYSDYERSNFVSAGKGIKTKEFGGHANELETSKVLYLRPDLVDMTKAVNDSSSKGRVGPILSPTDELNTRYSPSGIVGYAKLGTADKGQRYIKRFTAEVIKEIDSLSRCALPTVADLQEETKKYEGVYTSKAQSTNYVVKANGNHLLVRSENINSFSPHELYRNGDGHYSSQQITMIFLKNDQGQVVRAWCNARGESFWTDKLK